MLAPTLIRGSFLSLLVALTLVAPAPAADASIEMELATQQGFQPTETQKWYELLTENGVAGLRIRGGKAEEVVKIESTGTEARPAYRVRGVLTREGVLVVPKGKFKLSDAAALKKWLDELKTWGPQGAPKDKPLYGLNSEQYAKVKGDFIKSITFSTTDLSGREAIDQIGKSLQHKLAISDKAAAAITADDKVGAELRGISSGTALAYVIRPYGLVMRPERQVSGEIVLAIKPTKEIPDPWPIGVGSPQKDVDALPKLLEKLNVEIEPTPLAEVLPVIANRIDAPYLVDRNSLFKHDVDLAKVQVSFAKRKSWYKNILGDLLGQAKLKSEVRLDDAGKPFLWITTQLP